MKPNWSESEITYLKDNWLTSSVEEIALTLGRSKGAVRNKRYDLQLPSSVKFWTEAETEVLKAEYANAGSNEELNIDRIAALLSRTTHSVAIKAAKLGITNGSRAGKKQPKVRTRKFASDAERNAATSARFRIWHQENRHPKGMAGKSHTAETKDRLSKTSSAFRASLNDDQVAAIADKMLRSRIQSQGSLAPVARPRGSWKAGWRDVGEKRCYFRSRWEANYGRYLQWLKEQGQIAEWQHEPETFWFEAIKRGVRSYLPDFRVTENDGSTVLHEVKGWMDARSKTTLKRMAKYHPQEKLIVIREKQYKEIGKKVSALIEGWES